MLNLIKLVTSHRSMHFHNLPTSITIGNAQRKFKHFVKNLGFILHCHHATMSMSPLLIENSILIYVGWRLFAGYSQIQQLRYLFCFSFAKNLLL